MRLGGIGGVRSSLVVGRLALAWWGGAWIGKQAGDGSGGLIFC